MKRVFILIILLFCLTGCGIYNLSDFIMPDDSEFLAVVESLDTPEKICSYMKENFEWNWSIQTYSPYQMYLANLENWNDTGDCDEFATFAAWVAHYHGYEVYRMKMWCKFTGLYDLPLILPHVMGIYVENGKYTYSNNQIYRPIFAETFKEIVTDYELLDYRVVSWKVYDYEMNIVEMSE